MAARAPDSDRMPDDRAGNALLTTTVALVLTGLLIVEGVTVLATARF